MSARLTIHPPCFAGGHEPWPVGSVYVHGVLVEQFPFAVPVKRISWLPAVRINRKYLSTVAIRRQLLALILAQICDDHGFCDVVGAEHLNLPEAQS